MTTQSFNEATTRAQLVDAQLAHAGWNKSRRSLVEEFVLTAQQNEAGYNGQPYADYVLLGGDGKRRVTLIRLEKPFDLWDENYEKLTDQARRRLPLRSIRFLAPGG